MRRFIRGSRSVTALTGIGLTLIGTEAFGALTFNFTPTGNAQADAGFVAAGQLWSNLFNDNITININTGFSALSPGVLAQAGSSTAAAFYTDVRSALLLDASSSDDATAVANLPVGTPALVNTTGALGPGGTRFVNAIGFITNNEATGAREIDNNNTSNNFVLDINRANAKAIGLISGSDSAQDAAITFSNQFTYDFDRSDGISAGTLDFVAIAAHEIGHALGFVSGVDVVDIYSEPDGPLAPSENDAYRVYSVLDLFRYSDDAIAAGGDILDLAYGGTPFFSIDGSANLGLFSTGYYNGDGRQASHWKDNLGLGLLDPTLGAGEFANISPLDIRAFDVIGYNLIPEPASAGLLVGGVLLMLKRRAA